MNRLNWWHNIFGLSINANRTSSCSLILFQPTQVSFVKMFLLSERLLSTSAYETFQWQWHNTLISSLLKDLSRLTSLGRNGVWSSAVNLNANFVWSCKLEKWADHCLSGSRNKTKRKSMFNVWIILLAPNFVGKACWCGRLTDRAPCEDVTLEWKTSFLKCSEKVTFLGFILLKWFFLLK